MKRIIILIGVLISITAAQVVFGQANEGVITYEVKVNLHRRLPPERADMKSMIPEYRTTKEQLFFNGEASMYKPIIEDEEEQFETTNGGGGRMQMRFRQPNIEVYVNQNTMEVISKQEFMGKDYLILDTLKMSPWKFGTEEKTIQGYVCKQAYRTDETIPDRKQEITVWYTDKIRPFAGPERFNTLPGAVLAVDINNGERVIVATKIEFKALKKNDVVAPTKGEKITPAEFRKLMDEQMEKMRANGGMIIRN
jgi:GLPGLI family protein